MLSRALNERLCRIEGEAPMGRLLRRFWTPVLRSQALEAGGAPRRVAVFGERFAAFRGPDGVAGMFDEHCPHRCASLLLARNEPGGLRCIYHGWKFSAAGEVLEIPTEADPERASALAARVPLRAYPVREAGGLVWAYLGGGDAPAFPTFEFAALGPGHVDIKAAVVRANWLQAMESILDSAHLGFLHRSSIAKAKAAPSQKNAGAWLTNTAPVIEIEETDYGLREAAKRRQPDGRVSVRIREMVAPWHVLLPGEAGAERQHIITVPVSDGACLQFIITFNPFRPLRQEEIDTIWFDTHPDWNDIAQGQPGPELRWGQDREAMREGHFSGLTDRHVFNEDFAVLESMGPIADRTREFLTPTDRTIGVVRAKLLEAVEACEEGRPYWGGNAASFDLAALRTHAATLEADADWRAISAFVERPAAGRAAEPAE